MRNFLFLIFFPFVSQGQDLTKIKKVSLQYSVGYYNFKDTGNYEKEEIIEFIPTSKNRISRKTYNITKRYIVNPETKENNISVNDTICNKSDKSFSFTVFQNLLTHLNSTKDNFDKENILAFLSPISKKEVLSVATKCGKDYWFIDDENGKVDEFGRERIKKIKSFHLLDSFLLNQKSDLEYETVVTDAWNNLTISFFEQNDTTKYTFQFYSLLGQPFSKIVNNDFSHRRRYVNLEVNNSLIKILPRNSFTEKAIGFDALKEKYILWYIDNKICDK